MFFSLNLYLFIILLWTITQVQFLMLLIGIYTVGRLHVQQLVWHLLHSLLELWTNFAAEQKNNNKLSLREFLLCFWLNDDSVLYELIKDAREATEPLRKLRRFYQRQWQWGWHRWGCTSARQYGNEKRIIRGHLPLYQIQIMILDVMDREDHTCRYQCLINNP